MQSPFGITAGWRDALERTGARVHGYLPDDAYLVVADAESIAKMQTSLPVSYIGPYLPAYKRDVPRAESAKEFLVVVSGEDVRKTVVDRMSSLEGCDVAFDSGEIVRARLAPDAADVVTSWSEVVWLDLSVVNSSRPMNDISCGAEAMNVEAVWPGQGSVVGLTGRGQVVAVADTGLDTGDMETLHEDIRGRVVRAFAIGRSDDWSDFLGHGTHTCGSVAGNGARSGGRIKGPAYEASLIVQSLCGENGEEERPTDISDIFRQAYECEPEGARIHCDSWGAGREPGEDGAILLGAYVEDCRMIDDFCFRHPDFLVVFASGNDAVDFDGDGVVDGDSLNSQASSKNALVVGGAESFRPSGRAYGQVSPQRYPADPIAADDIASPWTNGVPGITAFSGRGPCDDGRIKPDVVAPATMRLAAKSSVMRRSGNDLPYRYMNGTSMAAPLVAGAAALVRQWLVESRGIANPDATTIKALLVAGARSLAPGQYGEGAWREIPSNVPNAVEGWGMVDIAKSVGATGAEVTVHDAQILAEGETSTFMVDARGGESISIVLAYADAPAEMAAAVQPVNDLDLSVVTPSGATLWPNSLDAPDRLNNIEGVKIPDAETGRYVVRVSAHAIRMPMSVELTGGRRAAIRYSLACISAIRSPHNTMVSTPSAELAAMSGSNLSAPARATTTTVEPPNLK